ncbi:MAG: TolC family protein, partial [Phycisphaerae bacterium]|nr:TolC family protein [Phycisphaerae bacterium]
MPTFRCGPWRSHSDSVRWWAWSSECSPRSRPHGSTRSRPCGMNRFRPTARRRTEPTLRRMRRGALLLAAVLPLLQGCQNELFGGFEEPWRVPPQKLREIAAFDPIGESGAKPETLDEAARRILTEGPRRLEFPSRLEVSIADVRTKALARNLDLKVVQIDPAIARAIVSEEEAKFEATFFANYTRNDNNLLTDLEEGLGIASDSGDAGVNFPLATGGTFSASGLFLRQDPNSPFVDQDAWQSGVSLSISQPLLRNAGIETNTASIRIARLGNQVAEARAKLEAIRVLANADRAYWSLYAAWKELEVRQEEYKLSMAQLERARNRVAAGDAAEIEVTRAESGVGQTVEAIIVADNQLRLRIRDLKRIMNDPEVPIDSSTALVPSTEPNPLGLTLSGDTLAARAVEDRMEMLELELQLAI